jgi:formylglycine-generating enzyme required for sulfatase activity
MQFGNLAWVTGWTSLSVLLAVLASVVGPGAIDRPADATAMIRIPGGAFTMGTSDAWPDERPAHRVELPAFEIDRVPVANAQFAAFLNERINVGIVSSSLVDFDMSRARIVQLGLRYVVLAGFEQHPVTVETWQGASAYCAARGARLPTEAEWERAARGAEGRLYPWGDEPPDASRARFDFKLWEYLPVGSYPSGATPDGVEDMAGNVAQWTSTRYAAYPYRADDGREDQADSGERVIRGGGASSPSELLRSSYRDVGRFQSPPAARPPVTFRCARDAG